MDVVDVIVGDKSADGKLRRLYAVVMLNYRQPLGDKAWSAISKLFVDAASFTDFTFLSGFLMGGNENIESAKFEQFIEKDLEKLKNA